LPRRFDFIDFTGLEPMFCYGDTLGPVGLAERGLCGNNIPRFIPFGHVQKEDGEITPFAVHMPLAP
jgi:hypothetical protein